MGGRRRRGRDGDPRPQLHIFGEEGRERAIGSLTEQGAEWHLVVILEQAATDLVRGRLSFRHGEERYDTAPVLVEDSAEAVVRRAAELPASMLRQLFVSARD